MLKKILKFTAELLIILIIALVLLKVIDKFTNIYSKSLWIGREKEEIKYRQKDELLHHSLTPNAQGTLITPEYAVHYKINSMGFRDYEYSAVKPKNTVRIVMAGDSYAEGYGAELPDTFGKVLERKLNNNKAGKKYEVINTGVVSYSPIIEYIQIKEKLIPLKPDIVVLVFSILTDINNDMGYAELAEFDKEGLPVKIAAPTGREAPPRQNFLEKLFYKEAMIFNKARFFFLRGFKKAKMATYCYGDIMPEANKVTGDDRKWEAGWEKTKHYLKSAAELLNNNGVKFAIVMMPGGHHVNAKEWDKGRKLYDYKVGLTYKNYVFDYMRDFCGENKIYYCDLLPFYQKSKIYPIFYPGDGHLTVEGNSITAGCLYDFLKTNKFIEK